MTRAPQFFPDTPPPPPAYRCAVCDRMAHHGYGVVKGSRGTWYCAEHRPKESSR
jgi:hypothetical protein